VWDILSPSRRDRGSFFLCDRFEKLSGDVHPQAERIYFCGFEKFLPFVCDEICFDGLDFCPEDWARRF
jgi:hypothetical protein